MSRRDTILVAVLINAGLLAILFATAMNKDNNDVFDRSELLNPIHQQIAAEQGTSQKEVVQEDPAESAAPAAEEVIVEAAPATQKPSEKEKPKEKEFVQITVKRGDFLEKIARANGTTIQAIMEANALSSTRLSIGQSLRIPLPVKEPTVHPQPPPTDGQQGESEYYIVQNGDNPWVISRRTGVQFEEILRLNSLNESRARHLKPGDRLRIR